MEGSCNLPPYNQVWIHADGTWSTLRRDGSHNFIYAVGALRLALESQLDNVTKIDDELKTIEVE